MRSVVFRGKLFRSKNALLSHYGVSYSRLKAVMNNNGFTVQEAMEHCLSKPDGRNRCIVVGDKSYASVGVFVDSLNMSLSSYRKFISWGLTDELIVEVDELLVNIKKHGYQGLSYEEITRKSIKLGISLTTVLLRIKDKVPADHLFDTANPDLAYFSHKVKHRDDLSDLVELLGIRKTTYRRLINIGYKEEDIQEMALAGVVPNIRALKVGGTWYYCWQNYCLRNEVSVKEVLKISMQKGMSPRNYILKTYGNEDPMK